ncbi:hypothetical protein Daesc_000024 [Daldinia eschscholtzii]|uniref:Uncharacterized protein n=1 Tax=Daldinia eschscholtzii TaxID=292717 RepID=A0AAX6MYI9_9PEZI
MVNRIMQEYMSPRRVRPDVYENGFDEDVRFGQIKGRDRKLGLDMQILSGMLKTDHNSSFTGVELRHLFLSRAGARLDPLSYFFLAEPLPTVGEVASGLVERYYIESEPSIRAWLDYLCRAIVLRPVLRGAGIVTRPLTRPEGVGVQALQAQATTRTQCSVPTVAACAVPRVTQEEHAP